MTHDPTRRFTDREVAIVLREASEIHEREGLEGGGALSLEDLKEIAGEVGIGADAVERAVQRLAERRRVGPASWSGAPLVRRAVRAIPAGLDADGVARLMQVVDERAVTTGTVSEALGTVRWTGSDRFRSSQVAVSPGQEETTIQVVEKTAPRLRRVVQLLPGAWAAMLAAPAVATMSSAAAVALTLGLSALAGLGVGRAVWSVLSAQSARRVERLASALSGEAHRAITGHDGESGPP